MINELVKLANELDNRGLVREADVVDQILVKNASKLGDLLMGFVSAPEEKSPSSCAAPPSKEQRILNRIKRLEGRQGSAVDITEFYEIASLVEELKAKLDISDE